MTHLGALVRSLLLSLCLLPVGKMARADALDERLMEGLFPMMELMIEVFPPAQVAHTLFGWAKDFHQTGEEIHVYACESTAIELLETNCSLSCQTLEALLRAHPTSDHIRNNAAWTRFVATGDAQGALELLRGVSLDDATILDTRACLYLALNRPADALQDILSALEMARTEANESSVLVLLDHAGDIFYRNALYPAANKAWTRALRLTTRFRKEAPAIDDYFLLVNYDDAQVRRKLRALRRLHPTPSE
ncbi:MAG: hypothetical protein MSB12_04390 [Lentisphaeraceae bacterium]|nr:hypothetical protein [Lentisphaeraceae bacterium]